MHDDSDLATVPGSAHLPFSVRQCACEICQCQCALFEAGSKGFSTFTHGSPSELSRNLDPFRSGKSLRLPVKKIVHHHYVLYAVVVWTRRHIAGGNSHVRNARVGKHDAEERKIS